MSPSQTPFPPGWWGTSLEAAGIKQRPRVGTYGCYDSAQLPPLPFEALADFAWLVDAPVQPHHNIGQQQARENAARFSRLRAAVDTLKLRLPKSFVFFWANPDLHKRIRSNTDCFLDLCPEPIPSPIGDGYLIRFLADSQGCVFWYLYLTPEADHAIVASCGFYGTQAEQWQDEPPDPDDIVFCAESFEAFLGRFWIENEIWYSIYHKVPLSELGKRYVNDYGAAK